MAGKRVNESPCQGRKRGRGATASRGRGRGRRPQEDDSSQEDEEALITQRRAQILEEDEEDVQGEYREEGGLMIEDIYIPPKHTRTEHPHVGQRLVSCRKKNRKIDRARF